jgi:hypothetical protein
MPLDLESVLFDAVSAITLVTRTPKKRVYNLYKRQKRSLPDHSIYQIFLRQETIDKVLKHECHINISLWK